MVGCGEEGRWGVAEGQVFASDANLLFLRTICRSTARDPPRLDLLLHSGLWGNSRRSLLLLHIVRSDLRRQGIAKADEKQGRKSRNCGCSRGGNPEAQQTDLIRSYKSLSEPKMN